MGLAIQVWGLTKRFGPVTALQGVDLRVREGEVLALLGPNGAGKTTTVRILAALLRPDRGRGAVAGADLLREPKAVRRRVGLLTEFPSLYEEMRPLPYLEFFGRLYGLSRPQARTRAEAWLRRFGLWEVRRLPIGAFSKGMKQKLALVRALLHEPQVLFLDEPTSAMDPESALQVREAVAELRREGRTILLCTHNLAEAQGLADRIALLVGGRIRALGTLEELAEGVLGPPTFRLGLLTPDPRARRVLEAAGAQILTNAPDALRFRWPSERRVREANHRLLKALLEAGVPVADLSPEPRTLEAVYLAVLGRQEGGEG